MKQKQLTDSFQPPCLRRLHIGADAAMQMSPLLVGQRFVRDLLHQDVIERVTLPGREISGESQLAQPAQRSDE